MKHALFNRFSLSVACVALLCGIARSVDYDGNYQGPDLTVVITPDGSAYAGEIRMGTQRFPLTAHEEADHLTGVFTSGGDRFTFTANLQNDGLTLVTGGATHALHRLVNPLTAIHPANPLTAIHPADPVPPAVPQTGMAPSPARVNPEALAGYAVLQSTDFGRAFIHEIPTAKTTTDALQATFPDLANYFGARPTIRGAYEDQKTHQSAFVAFSTQLNGRAVNGFVSSKIDDQGAMVYVVFGWADAPKAEWAKLTAKPGSGNTPSAGNSNEDVAAAAAQVPLTPYTFPNNTGTVGIAEGWTTNSPTIGGSVINGPADQQVIMCFSKRVVTPEYWQQHRRFAGPQAANTLIIAPYSPDPAEALKNVILALAEISRRNGKPVMTLDRIIQVTPAPAMNPRGNAALIVYDLTKTYQGESRHYRSLISLEVHPNAPGDWGYTGTEVIAPQETFRNDLPIMLAQCNSLKENAQVIGELTADKIARQKEWFDGQQAAHKKVVAAFDEQRKTIERNSLMTQRRDTNYDELLRGYRTVEDTKTGEKTSVDLGNVTNIVENLNRVDPDRYREIPLRDEVYPLPGRQR